MKTVWTLGLSVALAAAGSAAFAFQEQQGGGAPPASAPPQAAAPAPQDAGGKINLDTQEAAKAVEGTEVRIPGLGKLGVLPKMDFGLELLYGAADPKQADAPAEQNADEDELKIRGSLKHNF